jgi:hypothetical protein
MENIKTNPTDQWRQSMAKWKEHLAYDMETQRMKKAIQDIIDDSKNRITQNRQDELHGDPADHVWVDEPSCPTCKDGVCQCGPDEDECPDCGDPICDCWLDDVDEGSEEFRSVFVKPEYSDLFEVLRDALEEAQEGKGAVRHGNGLSFMDQPALTITRAVGLGFPLGQAMKKIQESQRMDTDAAKRELLGAINYLAAAVLFLNE